MYSKCSANFKTNDAHLVGRFFIFLNTLFNTFNFIFLFILMSGLIYLNSYIVFDFVYYPLNIEYWGWMLMLTREKQISLFLRTFRQKEISFDYLNCEKFIFWSISLEIIVSFENNHLSRKFHHSKRFVYLGFNLHFGVSVLVSANQMIAK